MQYRISAEIGWQLVKIAGDRRPTDSLTVAARIGAASIGAATVRERSPAQRLIIEEGVSSAIVISEGGPAGTALLAEGANPFAEIVSCKYLIPHVAGDGAGIKYLQETISAKGF